MYGVWCIVFYFAPATTSRILPVLVLVVVVVVVNGA